MNSKRTAPAWTRRRRTEIKRQPGISSFHSAMSYVAIQHTLALPQLAVCHHLLDLRRVGVLWKLLTVPFLNFHTWHVWASSALPVGL